MLIGAKNLAGPLAAVIFVAAVVVFGAVLEGFEQTVHPVSLLGATGVNHATAFNMVGYLLPGVLAVIASVRLIVWLSSGASAITRVAAQMMLLGAVAFAAMGLLPLDAGDVENRASQFHAVAWMVWVLAFGTGAVLMGLAGMLGPAPLRTLSALALGSGVWVLLFALFLEAVLPAAIAQRLALAGWLVWLALSPWLLSRKP
jgi:hypothetical membrane protein